MVSEGGCASAVSGDLRSGAPHTHYLSILGPSTGPLSDLSSDEGMAAGSGTSLSSDPVWPDVVRARDSRYEAGALPFQT